MRAAASGTRAKEWEWILGVNLWGVIHGVSVFVPRMLEQGDECHIVNTSSASGLGAADPAYQVTKHGVVTLSESLSMELAQQKATIGVSVPCPAFVQTNLHEAERNRPMNCATRRREARPAAPPDPDRARIRRLTEQTGIPPERTAEMVLQAIKDNQFYILTHTDYNNIIRQRLENHPHAHQPRPERPRPDVDATARRTAVGRVYS